MDPMRHTGCLRGTRGSGFGLMVLFAVAILASVGPAFAQGPATPESQTTPPGPLPGHGGPPGPARQGPSDEGAVAPQERGAVVEIGSRVRVEIDGDEMTWTIVGSTETNAGAGRISNMSPVGAALMNRRVGDAVTIRTPAGEVRYSVLAIE